MGSFSVLVTVTDLGGLSDSDLILVEVTPAAAVAAGGVQLPLNLGLNSTPRNDAAPAALSAIVDLGFAESEGSWARCRTQCCLKNSRRSAAVRSTRPWGVAGSTDCATAAGQRGQRVYRRKEKGEKASRGREPPVGSVLKLG